MQSRVDFPWRWQHVTGDTLIRTGQGVLHTIVINQIAEGALIDVFDGVDATGAPIAVISTAFVQPGCLVFDCEFANGLYIDITGAVDLTVTYK